MRILWEIYDFSSRVVDINFNRTKAGAAAAKNNLKLTLILKAWLCSLEFLYLGILGLNLFIL